MNDINNCFYYFTDKVNNIENAGGRKFCSIAFSVANMSQSRVKSSRIINMMYKKSFLIRK